MTSLFPDLRDVATADRRAGGRAGAAVSRRLGSVEIDGTTTPIEADAERVARLRALDLFALLPEQALARLADRLVRLVFPAGATIVRAGEPSGYVYVILEGSVELVSDGTVVAVRGPSECFGDEAGLDATAVAGGAVAVDALDTASFRA